MGQLAQLEQRRQRQQGQAKVTENRVAAASVLAKSRARTRGGPSAAGLSLSSLKIHLVVFQPTPFCNINCSYCYLPNRDSKKRITVEIVEAAIRNAAASDLLGDELSVIWHAGEPLAVPASFYGEAFRRIRAELPPRCAVGHAIQTNGMLIDEQWCELFHEFDVGVGVSLDGPSFVHDAHRRTRAGKGTHAQVMRGIELLRAYAIPFHVIAVVTRESLDHADEIFHFFLDQGIAEIGFSVDELEGENRASTLEGEEERFDAFLRRIMALASEHRERIRVREFERADRLIRRGLETYRMNGIEYPQNAQVTPFAITSVDCEGNFSMFSPELLGQRSAEYGDFVLGNVMRDSFSSVFKNPAFMHLYHAIRAGVDQCRRDCEYFDLCGGGAPANKFYENGTFASGQTQYCRRSIQGPLIQRLDLLDRPIGTETRSI
jgi:uncharacterized protein